MDLLEHVGSRIKSLRRAAGQSQQDLASALKVVTNTVSRWETGTYKPGIEDLDALARHFKVSILEFFPQPGQGRSEKVAALLRAAEGLKDEDIEELQRYAEFRRARSMYNTPKTPGRKKKDAS